MTCFSLPPKIEALVFDVDSTLYTNPSFAQSQIDVLVERFARYRGKSPDDARREVAAYRKEWSQKNGSKAISLGNVFLAFGVSIEESIRWREELIEPGRFLAADEKLREALLRLGACFSLGVVTNNPRLVAEKTLRALGVEDCFSAVIGLEKVSKPHRDPFIKAAALLGSPCERCVSVGDRYDIDLALPLELGMGGILVDGVEDVYALPGIFPAGRGRLDAERSCGQDFVMGVFYHE